MSVTTNDARSKAVLTALIDKVSTNYALSNILTDMGSAMKQGESIDIPTRGTAATIEDASSSGTPSEMTIQSQSPTANTLTVNKHQGSFIEVGKISDIFDMEGAWSSQMAAQVLTELGDAVDQDMYDELILTAAYDTSATYHVNPGAAALSTTHTRTALAKMLKQKGVRREGLVWVFDPYGEQSLADITAWQADPGLLQVGDLGLPTVGRLHGIPVVTSQSVRNSRSIACTAVSITSNVATVTVASGHGLVPGDKITITGITTELTTAAAITAVTSTTLTVPLTASNGAMGDGAGTVLCNKTYNSLVYMPWAFKRMQQVPSIRIVPREAYDSDVLQATMIWGKKALAGSCVVIGSPKESLS